MDMAWNLLPPPPGSFANSIGMDPFKAHLLYNRGIRHPSEIELFLSPDSRLLNDPMLLPDMELAVSRLKLALDSGETIGLTY